MNTQRHDKTLCRLSPSFRKLLFCYVARFRNITTTTTTTTKKKRKKKKRERKKKKNLAVINPFTTMMSLENDQLKYQLKYEI